MRQNRKNPTGRPRQARFRPIRLDMLKEVPAVTELLAGSLCEAAAVCLFRCEHDASNTRLHLHLARSRISAGSTRLEWQAPSERLLRARADLVRATEDGACAVAMLAVTGNTEFEVVSQSQRGTGADYWLGPKSCQPFEAGRSARLEVSGILKGSETDLEKRVREKKERFKRRPGGNIRTMICVVEFGTPRAKLIER